MRLCIHINVFQAYFHMHDIQLKSIPQLHFQVSGPKYPFSGRANLAESAVKSIAEPSQPQALKACQITYCP